MSLLFGLMPSHVKVEPAEAEPIIPEDAVLEKAGWVKISRRDKQITRSPRVSEVFWVDFAHDAYAPEMVGEHPGVVIRAARNFQHTCLIVPLASADQQGNPFGYKLTRNPDPKGRRDGRDSWAVCDHIYTIHPHRLRHLVDLKGRSDFVKMNPTDLHAIFALVCKALSHVITPAPVPPSAAPPTPARPIGPNTLTLKRP